MDRGFFITLRAIRRQLAAMPCDIYLLRLIDHRSRSLFATQDLWTACQLCRAAMVRFLRLRNHEGYDVYLQPYAGEQNAGYLLLDLDHHEPAILESMYANGHEPCVLLRTSPGHLQASLRVSASPLDPAVATEVGRDLARAYGGDLASADWRHLGRSEVFCTPKSPFTTLNKRTFPFPINHFHPPVSVRKTATPHLPRYHGGEEILRGGNPYGATASDRR